MHSQTFIHFLYFFVNPWLVFGTSRALHRHTDTTSKGNANMTKHASCFLNPWNQNVNSFLKLRTTFA